MATIKRRKLLQVFKRKGFKTEKGGPHIILYFVYKGQKTPYKTHLSKGGHGGTIGDYLIKQMASQLNISVDQFKGLYECIYKREDYIDFIESKLGPDPLDVL
jgi:hypothetical protein